MRFRRVTDSGKRAAAFNITASDWTEDILQRIGNALPHSTGNALPPKLLQGNAIQGFAEYEQKPFPKAFAIADGGHWNAVWGQKLLTNDAVATEAVSRCTKRGFVNCRVYAVNDKIIGQQ